jgi:cbb3-type cytochrome oxidase maturation protein
MSVLLILILASLGVALVFLAGFIWAVKSGQYEDTSTPSLRVLADDPPSIVVSNARPAKVRSS